MNNLSASRKMLKTYFQTATLTRMCFSTCCLDHQRKENFDDSWKWKSNYFKNHWNRETFGPQLDKKTRGKLQQSPSKWDAMETEHFWLSKMYSSVKKTSSTLLEEEDASSIKYSDTCNYVEKRENCEAAGSATKASKVSFEETGIKILAENYPLVNTSKSDDVTFNSTIFHPRISDADKVNTDANLVSVTKVLKATMPVERRLALQRWEERLVKEMGREKFDEMQRQTLSRGERLHSAIQSYFDAGTFSPSSTLASDADANDALRRHLSSLSPVINRFSRPPLTIESQVVHSTLGYKGYVDCVTKYSDSSKDSLCLVDWKTSKKSKTTLSSTFDTPIQIAAYVGAFNHDERYPVLIKNAIAVIIYNDGSPADVLQISFEKLEAFWKLWLQRLSLYRSQKDFGNPRNFETVEL